MRVGSGLSLAMTLAISLAVAHAPASAAERETCTKEGKEPRAYLDCLNRVQKASSDQLDAVVKAALANIEARQELQAAQRRRWTALFNESQGRFVNWRDFECQSIAPYEGGAGQKTVGGRLGGTEVIEQRMLCLTGLNDERSGDLQQRYQISAVTPDAPTPAAAPATEAPKAEAPATEAPKAEAAPAPATADAVPTSPAGSGTEPPAAADAPAGAVRVIDLPQQKPAQ